LRREANLITQLAIDSETWRFDGGRKSGGKVRLRQIHGGGAAEISPNRRTGTKGPLMALQWGGKEGGGGWCVKNWGGLFSAAEGGGG